jgi:hypothetical protein
VEPIQHCPLQRMPNREFAFQLPLHAGNLGGGITNRVPGDKPLHVSKSSLAVTTHESCWYTDNTDIVRSMLSRDPRPRSHHDSTDTPDRSASHSSVREMRGTMAEHVRATIARA